MIENDSGIKAAIDVVKKEITKPEIKPLVDDLCNSIVQDLLWILLIPIIVGIIILLLVATYFNYMTATGLVIGIIVIVIIILAIWLFAFSIKSTLNRNYNNLHIYSETYLSSLKDNLPVVIGKAFNAYCEENSLNISRSELEEDIEFED